MAQSYQTRGYPGATGGIVGYEGLEVLIQETFRNTIEDLVFADPGKEGIFSLFYMGKGAETKGFDKSDGFGKEIKFPLETQISGSFSAIGEGGTFPNAGAAQYINGIIPLRSAASTVAVSKQAELTSQKGVLANFKAMASEMKSLEKNLRFQMNRMLFGNTTGRLGVLASLDATSGTTYTVTLSSAQTWPTPSDARFLKAGMKVVGYRSGTATWYGTVQTDNTVATLNSGAHQIKIVCSAAPQASDVLYAGTDDPTADGFVSSYGNIEFHGFGGFMDNTFDEVNAPTATTPKLHGITVASYPLWQALNIDFTDGGSTVPLTGSRLIQATNKWRNTHGSDFSNVVMVMNPEMERQYWEDMATDARFTPTKYDGGYSRLTFNAGGVDIPIYTDIYMPDNHIYLIDKSACRYFWWEKPGFISLGSGNNIVYQDPNKAILKSVYTINGNFGTVNRRRMMDIKGISQDASWLI